MNLLDFINCYIQPNSIIRLVYKTKEGYEAVNEKWEDISMEWEIARVKGANRHYANNKVIGIAGILSDCRYPETINIVIEKMENQPFVKELKEDTSTQCESNKN